MWGVCWGWREVRDEGLLIWWSVKAVGFSGRVYGVGVGDWRLSEVLSFVDMNISSKGGRDYSPFCGR